MKNKKLFKWLEYPKDMAVKIAQIIGILMAVFDIIYFFKIENELLGWIGAAIAFFFFILLMLHKVIITQLGNQYAKRLFQEYLQS